MQRIYFLVLVVFLLISCKKDRIIRDDSNTIPGIATVSYGDDFGTLSYKEQLTYSSSLSGLSKIQVSYKTVSGVTGSYTNQFEKAGSVINSRSYNSEGQEVPFSLTTYNTDNTGRVSSAYYKTRDGFTRVFNYQYNADGFLAWIGITEDGKPTHLRAYYYSKDNLLDSCSLFQYHNGVPVKAIHSVYEYDRSRHNTLGNYYMMQGLGISNINAMKAFGTEQQYALKKETDYRIDADAGRSKIQEFEYSNVFDANKRIVQRDALIQAFQAGGNSIRINRNYHYSYE